MKLSGLSFCVSIGLALSVFPTIKTLAVTKAQSELPLVIAHRGASGDLPEHTLAAYELGIKQGAQIIEPDLVMTKDGILICRHENELSDTTNVAEVFPDRKTTKTIEGKQITGWFSEDFNLTEIAKLKVKQRFPNRVQTENWKHSIPTFVEFLGLIKKHPGVGIAPEIKHSKYFHGLQLDPEKALLQTMKKTQWSKKNSMTYIQSFEVTNLQKLKPLIGGSSQWQLVQLIGDSKESPADSEVTYEKMLSPQGLAEIRKYADFISPHRSLLSLSPDTVRSVRKAGLKLMTYTYRLEDKDVGTEENFRKIHSLAVSSGVDAIFSDYPGKSLEILKTLRSEK